MFRVSQGTVLRRAAAVSLVVLSTSLVACGDDEPTAASEGTTPTQAAAVNTDPSKGNPSLDEISTEDAAKVSDTPESKATIDAASTAKISTADLEAQIHDARKALKGAGEKPKSSPPAQGAQGSITVGGTSIIFYASLREAAEGASQFEKFSVLNPGYSRVARAENRVYVLSTQSKISDSDKQGFKELRDVVEGGV